VNSTSINKKVEESNDLCPSYSTGSPKSFYPALLAAAVLAAAVLAVAVLVFAAAVV
jgi:hypothetical protein